MPAKKPRLSPTRGAVASLPSEVRTAINLAQLTQEEVTAAMDDQVMEQERAHPGSTGVDQSEWGQEAWEPEGARSGGIVGPACIGTPAGLAARTAARGDARADLPHRESESRHVGRKVERLQ